MSFCTSLGNFIQIGPPSAEKNDVISIFKMADLSHLAFKGVFIATQLNSTELTQLNSVQSISAKQVSRVFVYDVIRAFDMS